MRTLFRGSFAKEADRPEANEDAFAFSADCRRLALCDGASESYDSRVWARLLASKFADDPTFSQEWLQSAIDDYMREHDFASMSWSQQLAFERGCFATLLGADYNPATGKVALIGVGDSVAVLFDNGVLAKAWPLNDPARFRERPTLLSTLHEHNKFTQSPEFDAAGRDVIDLADYGNPTLLFMTDALGEWTLRMSREEPGRLSDLLSIRTEEQLAALVLAERASKRMRVDDSTLIALKFDAENGNGLSEP
jgi:hypothetical protein